MANDNTAALPQFWALTGLRILMEETPALQAVNRQFAPFTARAGNQVNAWRADRRTIRRKTADDLYSAGDTNLTAVPVVLDQYFFDSFVIKDEENALSITELTRTHATPAVQTIARGINRAILGRVHAFLRQGTPSKRAGRLNKMTKTNASDFILEAEEVLAGNLAPMEGLNTAIVHHTTRTKLMGSPDFSRVDGRGVDQATVRTGQVGIVYNTAVIMSQDVNFALTASADTQTATINNSGGYAAGVTAALTVTDPGDDWVIGEYVVIDGNDQPTFLIATASATSLQLNEQLKLAVIDTAPITHYKKNVNESVERVAGYQKEMKITHAAAKQLQVGQLLSFGTGGTRHTYTVIERSATTSTTSTILLDRPLEITVASAADCFPGPGGSMNPILRQDAIAFVSRPMEEVNPRGGATSAVQNFDGVGIRVVEQYDSEVGGWRYNVDLLAGVSVLDIDLLCVMLA